MLNPDPSPAGQITFHKAGKPRIIPGPHYGGLSTGIHFTSEGIYSAMISRDRKGAISLEALEKISGSFMSESETVQGLALLKEKLPRAMKERVVSCLWGKNLLVAGKKFRLLESQEMSSALHLDFRKYVSFAMEKAHLQYQVLEKEKAIGEETSVLVSVADADLLNQHLRIVRQAGFFPEIVEPLPMSLGNARNFAAKNSESPGMALYLGPDVCILVFDGGTTDLYSRTIYVSPQEMEKELAGKGPGPHAHDFARELKASREFFNKMNPGAYIAGCLVSGTLAGHDRWQQFLADCLGLQVESLDLARRLGYEMNTEAGDFDLPLILAVQAQF